MIMNVEEFLAPPHEVTVYEDDDAYISASKLNRNVIAKLHTLTLMKDTPTHDHDYFFLKRYAKEYGFKSIEELLSLYDVCITHESDMTQTWYSKYYTYTTVWVPYDVDIDGNDD